ncbi:DNA-directed DNA polymerase II small subunit [Methanobrevibacter sp. OttesenSCG-928-I08]|nr:DNA-directed DNA polymerase II small subunit [Methanobrevibacter sp. OttesenSCG-928-I08]
MTNKILLKFAKKGINLSPKAYEKIKKLDDPLDFSSSLIVKLKSEEFSKKDLLSVSEEIVNEFINSEGLNENKDNKPKEIPLTNSKTEDKKIPNNKPNKIPITNSKTEDKKIPNETPIQKENSKIEEKIPNEPPIQKENSKIEEKIPNEPPIQKENSKIEEKIPNETPIQKENSKIEEKIPNEPPIQKENSKIEEKIPNEPPIQKENTDKKNKEEHAEKSEDIVEEKVADIDIKHSKRNINKTNVEYDFEIIQDTSKMSYTSGELDNLVTYFKNRYEKISKILSKRPELKSIQKISEIEEGQTSLSLILMVKDIRTTKNGHKLVEFEDETGSIPILFSNKDEELFKTAERLVKDEIVGVLAEKKGTLSIGTQIINPGIQRRPAKDMDFGIVFLSDIHIGSLTFLEDAFLKFVDWINCEYGSEKQVEVANDIKYLIIGGDIVDGIGIYPNQDKELAIKDITEQYDEAARLLGNIRSDIKIIIAPGNHDASRVAEPQPAVPEKYAKSLYELDNVEFISNPGVVSLDGINVLIYHGRGLDDMAFNIKDFSHEKNDLIMEELLKKRHLAPIYGERTPLASELEDYLVIDNVPDVFHTGHVHINTYRKFNGVHLINSGTFQTQTEFQKIYNIIPTPAEVPILHKGNYKLFKFI